MPIVQTQETRRGYIFTIRVERLGETEISAVYLILDGQEVGVEPINTAGFLSWDNSNLVDRCFHEWVAHGDYKKAALNAQLRAILEVSQKEHVTHVPYYLRAYRFLPTVGYTDNSPCCILTDDKSDLSPRDQRILQIIAENARKKAKKTGQIRKSSDLLTEEQDLLRDTADRLPFIQGYRRRGQRPWRDRALMYLMVELSATPEKIADLDLTGINTKREMIVLHEGGEMLRQYRVSQMCMRTLQEYFERERVSDAKGLSYASPWFFLPPGNIAAQVRNIPPSALLHIWNKVCVLAGILDKKPGISWKTKTQGTYMSLWR